MLTADQALDRLMHLPKEDLYEICYDAHRDQYGAGGSHLSAQPFSELINWYVTHYAWNETHQYWETKIPFDDEIYASQEDEYDYYRQFG
jgi:hypothetical protein